MRPDCRRLVCPTRSHHNVLQGIRGWHWGEISPLFEVTHGVWWEGECYWAVPRQPATRVPGSEPGTNIHVGAGPLKCLLQSEVVQEMIDSTSLLNILTQPSGDCHECFKLDCFIRYLGK